MKINYQEELINLIHEQKGIPNLLLHSCCGPCSTEVINFLTPYFNITVLYYNPNIEPVEEYIKRKNEQIRFIKEYKPINKLDYLECDYDNEAFNKATIGLENVPEGGIRCSKCFTLRLQKCASIAKENHYDYFGTTLTVSPHKNSQIINEIGLDIANNMGLSFLVGDFKKNDGYLNSIKYSKDYQLYRQDYCGCHYSNWHIDK